MPGLKYVGFDGEEEVIREAIQSSAGAGSAGAIPALDSAGKLATNMMPDGLGVSTVVVPASENLSAGDIVDLWVDSGTLKARKADATAAGKPADGFVQASVTSGDNATVSLPGQRITGLTGLDEDGDYYLSTTPGAVTAAPSMTTGSVLQFVGKALSETVLFFNPGKAREIV